MLEGSSLESLSHPYGASVTGQCCPLCDPEQLYAYEGPSWIKNIQAHFIFTGGAVSRELQRAQTSATAAHVTVPLSDVSRPQYVTVQRPSL